MSEELLEFENTVEDEHGRSHVATVLGSRRVDGKWEGFVRFRDADGHVLETDRETTQPNRDDLVYWSKGLTYFYLEGALARAKRRALTAAGVSARPAVAHPPVEATRLSPIPRLEVLSLTSRPLELIMGTRTPRSGTSRDVPDAGVVVYEGAVPEERATRYHFALQFGSDSAGAVLSNWLWTRLRDSGAEVRVDGVRIEVRNDELARAILAR